MKQKVRHALLRGQSGELVASCVGVALAHLGETQSRRQRLQAGILYQGDGVTAGCKDDIVARADAAARAKGSIGAM